MKNRPSIAVAACAVSLLFFVFLTGCTTVRRVAPLQVDVISDAELETVYPYGAEGRFEARWVSLSDFQKFEYHRLSGEAAPDTVFFYNASVRQVAAGTDPDRLIGEIYVEHGTADTGEFSYFVFVSHGVARRVTLRRPGSLEGWEKLQKMLTALEDKPLEAIRRLPSTPLTRGLRRALALHAVLTPTPLPPVSPMKRA